MMDLSKLEETAPVRTQLGCRAADAARSGLKREDNLNSPTTTPLMRLAVGCRGEIAQFDRLVLTRLLYFRLRWFGFC